MTRRGYSSGPVGQVPRTDLRLRLTYSRLGYSGLAYSRVLLHKVGQFLVIGSGIHADIL